MKPLALDTTPHQTSRAVHRPEPYQREIPILPIARAALNYIWGYACMEPLNYIAAFRIVLELPRETRNK
jgi:hypothetical protein